jgi:hypothetical protein
MRIGGAPVLVYFPVEWGVNVTSEKRAVEAACNSQGHYEELNDQNGAGHRAAGVRRRQREG